MRQTALLLVFVLGFILKFETDPALSALNHDSHMYKCTFVGEGKILLYVCPPSPQPPLTFECKVLV